MNCPLCLDQTLEPVFRSGIEIDVCPQCRGMWLDRGELDKLIVPAASAPGAPTPADRYDPDRSGVEGWAPAPAVPAPTPYQSYPGQSDRDRTEPRPKGKGKGKGKGKSKSKRKKSWSHRLGELIEDVIDELD